ncbi:MAG: SDR family NAD(P)-dependent oxidoreductase [Candidatus Kapaibacteriales bacterium]
MLLSGKTAFISGATSGIGLAIAETFAENGAKLILLARRKKRLKELSKSLLSKFSTETYLITADVRFFEILEREINNIPENFKNIDILINNAGLARGLEKIYDGKIDDWNEMIDTNIKGILYLTKLISPIFLKKNSGHIVNIASIAGRQVYPNGNVYCATKSAVKTLSEAMIIDFNGTNIKITNVDPGLVKTEFSVVRFHGDKARAKAVYSGYKPLSPYDVANVVLFCVTLPEHVVVQDILITPLAQATTTIVNKKLS